MQHLPSSLVWSSFSTLSFLLCFRVASWTYSALNESREKKKTKVQAVNIYNVRHTNAISDWTNQLPDSSTKTNFEEKKLSACLRSDWASVAVCLSGIVKSCKWRHSVSVYPSMAGALSQAFTFKPPSVDKALYTSCFAGQKDAQSW